MGTQKEPSVKWSEADIQLIVSWLSERNSYGDLSNLYSYQSGNKSDAALKFLVTTGLDVMFERSERDAARRHEQVMSELEEQRIRSKIQLAAMKRGKNGCYHLMMKLMRIKG